MQASPYVFCLVFTTIVTCAHPKQRAPLKKQYTPPQYGSKGCQRQTLSKIDPIICLDISSPQLLSLAIESFDCRLRAVGKPGLKCTYVKKKGTFQCSRSISAVMAGDIINSLFDFVEICHPSATTRYNEEVSSMVSRLASITQEQVDTKIGASHTSSILGLIEKVKHLQDDNNRIGDTILKASLQLQELSQKMWNSLSSCNDSFLSILDYEMQDREHKSDMYETQNSKVEGRMEWAFSFVCACIFLFALRISIGDSGAFFMATTSLLLSRAYVVCSNASSLSCLTERFTSEMIAFQILYGLSLLYFKTFGNDVQQPSSITVHSVTSNNNSIMQ